MDNENKAVASEVEVLEAEACKIERFAELYIIHCLKPTLFKVFL